MVENLNKLEIAQRQIIESIRLFFEERDVVAIHTLIASAHQILFDIGKTCGVASSIKATNGLRKPEIQELLKSINYPYNFFKHADNDPEDLINIEPLKRLTSDFIMDAIVMHQQLSKSLPMEAKVFWFWFVSKYPQEFDNLHNDGAVASMQEQNMSDWDFPTISQFISFGKILNEAKDSV